MIIKQFVLYQLLEPVKYITANDKINLHRERCQSERVSGEYGAFGNENDE